MRGHALPTHLAAAHYAAERGSSRLVVFAAVYREAATPGSAILKG
jgi:hypothetical protein